MKAKRILAVILAAAMCTGAFAGCSGDTTTSSAGAASTDGTTEESQGGETATGDPVTLTWLNSVQVDVTPYIEEFTKQYEEETGVPVTIEITASTDDWMDTVKTAVAAGSGPDIWNMDVNWLSAWKDTVIQPLDPYIDSSVFEQYSENGIDLWKSGDHYYALPVTFSVVGFMYNKDLTDELGLDMSKTWTFEEFESYLEKADEQLKGKTVTYSDGNEYPYILLGSSHTMYYWWLLVGVEGGTALCDTNNIAQNAFVEGILKMAEWRSKGWTVQQVTPGNTTAAFSDAGNVLFWPTGDWTITALVRQPLGIESEPLPVNTNYASIAAPLGADGKSHTEVYNQGMVMNKNVQGEAAKAGAEFIRYMTNDAWNDVYGPGAYNYSLPGRTDWMEEYTSWLPDESAGSGFLETLEEGVIHSPDYNAGGIDLTSSVQNVVEAAYAEVEANGYNEDTLRSLIVSKLESEQELLNVQLQENGIELDNPDAKVK